MKISRESLIFFLYGKDEIGPKEDSMPSLPSVPSDILLGRSMIPGAVFGVFARQHISKGLVVGPLFMTPKYGLMRCSSPSYTDEQLIHDSWAWLKYIQPARHPFEENARVETSEDGLYFRVTRDIAPGSEILAWLSDPALRLFGLEVPIAIVKNMKSPCSSPSSPESSPIQELDKHMHHKAICRLCGKTYSTYVELWAHVTTFHTSQFANHGSSLLSHIQHLPPTLYNYSQQQTALPITPLTLRSPLSTRPYPTSSPRHTTTTTTTSPGASGDNTSPIPSSELYATEDVLPLSECRDTERPYECGHCGKSFSLPSSLRRHIITHTGERPYKCGYCGRAFAGATTLNNHIRIHTGEKPHVCHDCGAGFTQATQLNRHIRCCSKTKNMSQGDIFIS